MVVSMENPSTRIIKYKIVNFPRFLLAVFDHPNIIRADHNLKRLKMVPVINKIN